VNAKKVVFIVSLAVVLGSTQQCLSQAHILDQSPRLEWLGGGDIVPTLSAGDCFTPLRLFPNVTTVYTDALRFVLHSKCGIKLEIASVDDSGGIIWGIRFYVYKFGASTTSLTLVDGVSVVINDTDGSSAVCQVGYRQLGANEGYGSTITPVDSNRFTGADSDVYKVVIEAYDHGTLCTQTATIQLKLIWS